MCLGLQRGFGCKCVNEEKGNQEEFVPHFKQQWILPLYARLVLNSDLLLELAQIDGFIINTNKNFGQLHKTSALTTKRITLN